MGIVSALSKLGLAKFALSKLWPELGALAAGAAIEWNKIPTPIKDVLVAGGIAVGTLLINDLLGGGAGGTVPPGFNPAWKANGIQFYRNANGLLGVMNAKGRWKQWRPKHPIVMFSSGAKNLKTFDRAATALRRQARRLKSDIDALAGGERKLTKAAARKELMADAQATRELRLESGGTR
jgi:hypothetical protein